MDADSLVNATLGIHASPNLSLGRMEAQGRTNLISTVGRELAELGQASAEPEEEKPNTFRADQTLGARRRGRLPDLRQAAKNAEESSGDPA